MSHQSKSQTQHSAGGVVYRYHHQQIDVCMIKDSYGHWTFPKGHLEEGETLEETARREIAEETGIDEHVLQHRTELGEISYWFNSPFRSDGGSKEQPALVHKFVTYYLYEVPYETDLKAQPGEVEEIAWMPLEVIEDHNQYEDNIPIIQKAKGYLLGRYRG